jgi:copper(I)-binding protein
MKLTHLLALAAGLATSAWAQAQVTVTQPWTRATAPGQSVAGVYMQITSARAGALVSAASPAAKTVEIHEMVMEKDVMKMRPVPRVALPAGKPVELKPGGYHVMLIGITAPLKRGEAVPVTLTVEQADGKRETLQVKAEVRDAGGMHGSH